MIRNIPRYIFCKTKNTRDERIKNIGSNKEISTNKKAV